MNLKAEPWNSWLIILFVIIPLFTAFLIPLLGGLLPWLGRTAVSAIMLFLVALAVHILLQACRER
jgi:hypothetical protein